VSINTHGKTASGARQNLPPTGAHITNGDLMADTRTTNAQGSSDPIAIYWRDIKDYQPLTRHREGELVKLARRGSIEAMHELVSANLRFVVSVAKDYSGYGLSFNELISEGNTGLLEAVKRFDETRGFKFITYAVWWIRQGILKALAEQSKAARPPMSQVNDLQKVEKRAGYLTQELGREPTLEEIAENAEISLDRARNALAVGQRDVSFDTPIYAGEDDTLLSVYVDDETTLDEDFERDELNKNIHDCLQILDEREHQIVRSYFGMEGQTEMTLEKIGATLGLTRERVRQLRDRALQKMRSQWGTQLLELSRN